MLYPFSKTVAAFLGVAVVGVIATISSTAQAYTCPDWVKQLKPVQTYTGEIGYTKDGTTIAFSDPATLRLRFRPKNCSVVGDFSYHEVEHDNRLRKGQLSQVQPGVDGTLSMVWHDPYGFGLLDIRLNKNLQTFEGKWGGAYTNEYGGTWTGKVTDETVSSAELETLPPEAETPTGCKCIKPHTGEHLPD